MTHLKKLASLLLMATLVLNIGCSDDKKDDGGGVTPPPPSNRVELVGNITGTRTLSKDTVYFAERFCQRSAGSHIDYPRRHTH